MLSPEPLPDVTSLYNLDFEVLQEGWSVYELEDLNKIRARVILQQIRGPNLPPKKGDRLGFSTNVIIIVDAPPSNRGPKGIPATQEEITNPKEHGGVEIAVRSSREPWNEYRIVGSNIRVRLKMVLNRVWRIQNRYDQLGDPVYVVNQTVLPIIEG